MDLSGRLTLLIYLHSKRLKQTLSPHMVILFRTIKKHVNLSKQINGHQREKTRLRGFRPCMTRSVTAKSLRMLNLYVYQVYQLKFPESEQQRH